MLVEAFGNGSSRAWTPSRWILGFIVFGWVVLAGCSDPEPTPNQQTCDTELCESLNDGCLPTVCDQASKACIPTTPAPDGEACTIAANQTAGVCAAGSCIEVCDPAMCAPLNDGCLPTTCDASQTCVPAMPAPDGVACTLGSSQTAGVCAAGECVENPVQQDCALDEDCSHLDTSACDAPTCQGVRQVHSCSETKHCVPTQVDDDTLCAGEIAIDPCPNGFAVVACSDTADQPVPVCATTCDPHQLGAPCSSDLRCNSTGTACVAWPELGWNILGHPPASGLAGVVNAVNVRLGELRDHGVDTTKLWLRPRSGAASQVHLNVWLENPQLLQAWKTLQDEYGFKIVWTINCDVVGKDEDAIVADEMTLYQNALAIGLQIHLNEAGNEQYLESKFPGMTVERYLQIAQRYDTELAFTNLPMLIQIAPQGKFEITNDAPQWMLTIEAH